MIKSINGKAKVFFGVRKEDKSDIYISKPTFNCNWYWSFGCLENRREHYHLIEYQEKSHSFRLSDNSLKLITEKRRKDMHDCLLEDYDLSPQINENLWLFCELALTIYKLKGVAEMYYIGGSNVTTNPCKDIIKDIVRYEDINFHILPELLQKFWDLVSNNLKIEKVKKIKDKKP